MISAGFKYGSEDLDIHNKEIEYQRKISKPSLAIILFDSCNVF